MGISTRGLLALRGWIIVAVVLAWNGAMGVGIYLNGGLGSVDDPTARLVVSVTAGVAALFALIIVFVRPVRSVVLAPTRVARYEPAPYVLVGVVCGVLCWGFSPL